MGFGIDNLPYGVARPRAGGPPRVVTRIDDRGLDLAAALGDDVFADDSLNRFMAQGPQAWADARGRIVEKIDDGPFLDLDDVDLLLPWTPHDYVDFYASEAHATNLGRMFRPDSDPLFPNWRHLPVGYHGRTSTIVVSGTPITVPVGLVAPGERRPSTMLDVEVEVGTVLGVGNERGEPVAARQAWDRVFGFVLVNDWSARDIQRFEYQPLGPHLGKSFATSVSPWVVPAAAVEPFLVDGPPQDDVDDFLRVDGPRVFDLELELHVNDEHRSTVNARELHWGPAQFVAHVTGNGASTRPGDLYGSGTVSNREPGACGSLLELGGPFLQPGDTVTIRGRCGPVSFGDVSGSVIGGDGQQDR